MFAPHVFNHRFLFQSLLSNCPCQCMPIIFMTHPSFSVNNSIITYRETFTICISHDRRTDVIGIDCHAHWHLLNSGSNCPDTGNPTFSITAFYSPTAHADRHLLNRGSNCPDTGNPMFSITAFYSPTAHADRHLLNSGLNCPDTGNKSRTESPELQNVHALIFTTGHNYSVLGKRASQLFLNSLHTNTLSKR